MVSSSSNNTNKAGEKQLFDSLPKMAAVIEKRNNNNNTKPKRKTISVKITNISQLEKYAEQEKEDPNQAAVAELDLSELYQTLTLADITNIGDKFPHLTSLNLGWSQAAFSGTVFDLVTTCRLSALASTLTTLNLCDVTTLKDDHLREIKWLKSLKHLNVNTSSITDVGIRYISELPALEVLECSSLLNITNGGLTHLANCKTLRELDLGSCEHITDLSQLLNAPSLDVEKLNVKRAGVKQGDFESFKKKFLENRKQKIREGIQNVA